MPTYLGEHKLKVDITDDQINLIVYNDLKIQLSAMKKELAKVKKEKKGSSFYLDYKEDIAILKQKIFSLEDVISLYETPKQ